MGKIENHRIDNNHGVSEFSGLKETLAAVVAQRIQGTLNPGGYTQGLNECWNPTTMKIVPPQHYGVMIGFPSADNLIARTRKEANLGIGSV